MRTNKHGTITIKNKSLIGYVATVEERKDGMFLSTFYDKDCEYEADRRVVEFESFGAALAHMYETLFNTARKLCE